MPLSLADMSKAQIVRRIGGNPEVKKHLEDLGFNVGSEVSVISTLGGNLIVKVMDKKKARPSVAEAAPTAQCAVLVIRGPNENITDHPWRGRPGSFCDTMIVRKGWI